MPNSAHSDGGGGEKKGREASSRARARRQLRCSFKVVGERREEGRECLGDVEANRIGTALKWRWVGWSPPSASWTTQPESAPFAIRVFKKSDQPRPALGSLTTQEGS